jgi:Dual-action HEIGH metallo-peptidase
MSKRFFPFAALVGLLFAFNACKKADAITDLPGVPDEVRAKIKTLGFSDENVIKDDGGYVVEGDIFLSDEDLNEKYFWQTLVVANAEHYRTTNLVTGLPRTITVRYSGSTTSISNAINAAIARYNNANLRIRFTRVTTSANITISNVSGVSYIASAGFPSGGNPFNSIRFNTAYSTLNSNTLTTVLAHEMGHCIGFRHTDYACRQFSCGGSPVNEGSAGVGAIHVPGTPTACNGDGTSWMLACIGNGVNRPFNSNDVVALNYVY